MRPFESIIDELYGSFSYMRLLEDFIQIDGPTKLLWLQTKSLQSKELLNNYYGM